MRTSGMKQRLVHLVDIENAVGCSSVTQDDVRRVRAAYLGSGLVGPRDQVIVGVSHHNVIAVGLGWPEARRVVRSGKDGADLALQEVMATEQLDLRFGACVVVTGDGGFALPVAQLIARGLSVAVVGPLGRTAAALRLASTVSRHVDFTVGTSASRSVS